MSYKKIATQFAFRGIRKDNDELIEGGLIEMNDGVYICECNVIGDLSTATFNDLFTEVYRTSIHEYTNMKDVDGNMLFVGDICRNNITREHMIIERHNKHLMLAHPHENNCSLRFALTQFRSQKITRIGSMYTGTDFIKQ